MHHAGREAHLQACAGARPEQVVADERLVVGVGRDQRHLGAARDRSLQRLEEREGEVGADHHDGADRRLDPLDQGLEALGVAPPVQAVQLEVAGGGAPAPAAALIGRQEVVGEQVRGGRILDPQHQVGPFEIMVAEVDPADVGDLVGDDDLLVVPERPAGHPRAERIGHAHPHAPGP